jgi:hypothetical protein
MNGEPSSKRRKTENGADTEAQSLGERLNADNDDADDDDDEDESDEEESGDDAEDSEDDEEEESSKPRKVTASRSSRFCLCSFSHSLFVFLSPPSQNAPVEANLKFGVFDFSSDKPVPAYLSKKKKRASDEEMLKLVRCCCCLFPSISFLIISFFLYK